MASLSRRARPSVLAAAPDGRAVPTRLPVLPGGVFAAADRKVEILAELIFEEIPRFQPIRAVLDAV
jgi:hypothetical protein